MIALRKWLQHEKTYPNGSTFSRRKDINAAVLILVVGFVLFYVSSMSLLWVTGYLSYHTAGELAVCALKPTCAKL
jgi:hypothetical protein